MYTDPHKLGSGKPSPKPAVLACILAVSAVTLVTYYPAARIGFVNNDWIYLDWVARWSLPQYFYHYLVPGTESGWYRPLFGIYFWAMYVVFGANQNAYHLAYILLHLLNGLLVFALVKRVTANLSLAVIAALLYVGFPAYSKAVYWPSTPDTIAMVFYLGAIWFWLDLLKREERRSSLLAFVAFVLALMTKESSMTLPIVLFLVDRILVRGSISWRGLIRRYLPFLLVWIPYLIMEYALQRRGSYVSLAGYGFGMHMLWNLLNSLATLVYPWQLDPPLSYALGALVAIAFLVVTVARRSMVLTLLGMLVLLNLAPVIGFPTQWFEMRYLYYAAIVSAIIFAMVFDGGRTKVRWQRPYIVLASGIVAMVLIANASAVGEAASAWGEIARQRAVPFRDIERSHPTFPGPTKLYFIDSKITPVFDLSVMFLLHYGPSVTVDGSDDNQPNQVARLREVPTSYLYYFDATGKPMQVPVSLNATTYATPMLPATWSAPIQLEGYEIVNNSLRRGEPLILFLYWRADEKLTRDYTLFVHLLDETGKPVDAYDDHPLGGKDRTSTWKPGQLIVDSIVMPIMHDTPPGAGYSLAIGISDHSNGERLLLLDSDGRSIGDKVMIEPFRVTE